ncbi:glycoside hydrolase family 15 protein [Streptomyces sp. NPDC048606]|uniref:glycoside hydrolase family 15 protein n=1 Tax=Streptomyces sp. NPDC048606 TaxID=3154726 RepID=UPI00341A2393
MNSTSPSSSPPIEGLAVLSDSHTAALVDAAGSVVYMSGGDRPDSPLVFARLLGEEENGFWRIRPYGPAELRSRSYRRDTMITETVWDVPQGGGTVTVVDHMAVRGPGVGVGHLIREVRLHKAIAEFEFRPRFDDGLAVPNIIVGRSEGGHPQWTFRHRDRDRGPVVTLVAHLAPGLETDHENGLVRGRLLRSGAAFVMSLGPQPSRPVSPVSRRASTQRHGRAWVDRNVAYRGRYEALVKRSMLTLEGLRYAPTGAIIAAATTSLPEALGGVRNWDYQHHWWRDADITLTAMIEGGAVDGLAEWRAFALKTIGDDPAGVRIMCGVAGEQNLPEREIGHLSGYENSRPVRRGNAAVDQFQLDVYGSIVHALVRIASRIGWTAASAQMVMALARVAEARWREPDSGLWESRGGRKHHTYSKVMAWLAVDRARELASTGEVPAVHDPLEAARLRAVADLIRADVLTCGFDQEQQAFTQSYGGPELDASLLRLPLIGFIAADDPRMVGTVEALMDQLVDERGFMLRYRTTGDRSADGLPGHEGRFLMCSFWLVEVLARIGRQKEAAAIFDNLVGVAGPLGLLAEEYQPAGGGRGGRQLGNFPQALSHAGLISAAAAMNRSGAWSDTSQGAGA